MGNYLHVWLRHAIKEITEDHQTTPYANTACEVPCGIILLKMLRPTL